MMSPRSKIQTKTQQSTSSSEGLERMPGFPFRSPARAWEWEQRVSQSWRPLQLARGWAAWGLVLLMA